MNILFVHQNFPGQFKHLAPALAQKGHKVVALHINACSATPGVQLVRYQPQGRSGQGTHRWLVDLETKTIRGEAAYHAARQLQHSGFTPDVIVAHPGWGESLFCNKSGLRHVWAFTANFSTAPKAAMWALTPSSRAPTRTRPAACN